MAEQRHCRDWVRKAIFRPCRNSETHSAFYKVITDPP